MTFKCCMVVVVLEQAVISVYTDIMVDFDNLLKFRNDMRQAGLEFFIFGGWSTDILNSAQTRSHLDIDFVIWQDKRNRLLELIKSKKGSIHRNDVKTVFTWPGIYAECMYLRKEGQELIFEGAHFRAKVPESILLPFSTAVIKGEEFPIGLPELIVKMTQDFAYHGSDRQIAAKLQVDNDVMAQIQLSEK